jgi:hypothetical protein
VSRKTGRELQFIFSSSSYVYPKDYFFDTAFHLNDTGKVIRTQQLIIDLKNIYRVEVQIYNVKIQCVVKQKVKKVLWI